MVLVLVSLDPHAAVEVEFELPLWEWGLPDHGSLAVTDLMRERSFLATGKRQRVPASNPGRPAVRHLAPRPPGTAAP